jgi:hypothetical protein
MGLITIMGRLWLRRVKYHLAVSPQPRSRIQHDQAFHFHGCPARTPQFACSWVLHYPNGHAKPNAPTLADSDDCGCDVAIGPDTAAKAVTRLEPPSNSQPPGPSGTGLRDKDVADWKRGFMHGCLPRRRTLEAAVCVSISTHRFSLRFPPEHIQVVPRLPVERAESWG